MNAFADEIVRGRTMPFERRVWRLPAAVEQPDLALLFLDGELYLERVEAAVVLDHLQRTGTVPSVASFFVSHKGAAARHADFTCRLDYATFIADDVYQWILERNPSVRQIILAGLSLSGLASAFIATRFPRRFMTTICQSPSFWWEEGRFGKELGHAVDPAPRFWVCVGDQETDRNVSHPPSGLFQKLTQIEGCDAGCNALRHHGYDVSYRTYSGGHDPICWREDLMLALPWACRSEA